VLLALLPQLPNGILLGALRLRRWILELAEGLVQGEEGLVLRAPAPCLPASLGDARSLRLWGWPHHLGDELVP